MLPASSAQPSGEDFTLGWDNFPAAPSHNGRENLAFCNVLNMIPSTKTIPKRDALMPEFIQSIHTNLIENTELIETHSFANDEMEVCLRRRKLGIKAPLMSYQKENQEIYLIGIDESQEIPTFKLIGDTTIKSLRDHLLIKSKKSIHEVMKKCEKCRLVIWVCSKDEKVLQELLVSVGVYPVASDKAEVEKEFKSRKKVKPNPIDLQTDTPMFDLTSQAPTTDLATPDSISTPIQSIQSASTDIMSGSGKKLTSLSKEELIERIHRLEGRLEEKESIIGKKELQIVDMYTQIYYLSQENLALKNLNQPSELLQNQQEFIEHIEDAKENVNQISIKEFSDNFIVDSTELDLFD